LSSSATFIKFRVNSAEQFKESVSEPTPNTNMYLTYGKVDAWANDANADIANTSVSTEYQIWSNMIGGKKILGYDISHVIRRINWVANTSYTSYDHRNANLYDGNTNFYVVTSDYNVYKCIGNNNNSLSTVEPTTINFGSTVETSDGYIWKYMYSISDSDQLRFTTSNYIPVRVLAANDGSLQWQVQDNAIEGAIYHIKVANTGTNYSNTSNIGISISGDGSGADAIVTLNTVSNTVSSITMTNYGQNYTYATVAITGGGGSNASVIAMISPPGGHGSSPIYEFGGSAVMINTQLKSSEGGKLPATNDVRQIAILKDPLLRDGSAVSSNIVFQQGITLTTAGSGDYQQDEIVYQGTSVSTATFSGKVVSWDSANGRLVVINTTGNPLSQSLVGANTSTSRFIGSIIPNYLKLYSGQLLYVNNLEPITRSADQTEDYRIVLKF
jgi:hypothetical protein